MEKDSIIEYVRYIVNLWWRRLREKFLEDRVEDVYIDPSIDISLLVEEIYSKIHGFMAGHLSRGASILKECLPSSDLRVLTFTANLVATGLRGILRQLIEEKIFNLVITTCGSIDHDIARSSGGTYYKGYFEADDKTLRDAGIHRLGNIYIPSENYGPLVEKVVYRVLDKLDREKVWSVYEILWEIGSTLPRDSILYTAYSNKIPIIVPGFLDGAFGTALFTYMQVNKDLQIDLFMDEDLLAKLFFSSKKASALILGGGISKHHAIWWAQFRDGYECTVYITTSVEYDGSLSGAHTREAISWSKIKPNAKHVVIHGDATIILPLIVAPVLKTWLSSK